MRWRGAGAPPEIAAALLAGGWIAAFMPNVEPLAWLLVPLGAAGAALAVRFPVPGALLVLAASALAVLLRLPYAEIELLLPTLGVLYWVGRQERRRTIGALLIAAFVLATVARGGWNPLLMFPPTAVYGAGWFFGMIVGARARDAAAAAAESARLARVDFAAVVGGTVSTSGTRIAREALSHVRSAVEVMRDLAAGGDETDLRERAAAIREEGDRAITTLHGIIKGLEGPTRYPAIEPDPAPALAPGPERGVGSLSSRQHEAVWSADGAGSASGREHGTEALAESGSRTWPARHIALALAGAAVVILASLPFGGPHPSVLLLALTIPPAAVLAERFPLSAACVAALAFLLSALRQEIEADALLPVGAFLALLVWHLATVWTPPARFGLLLVGAAAMVLGLQYGRQGAGFVLAAMATAFMAARAWLEKDGIVLREQTLAARRSVEIAEALSRAERAERERIAHELHDGVSYAITAMSLHAQAAGAVAERDPALAHTHLRTAEQAGTTALGEIATLSASWREADARSSDIPALVASAREFGQQVECTIGPEGMPPGHLAYRIVQECLTNAARHAPGSSIRVQIGQMGGQWSVCVADSGAPAITDGGAFVASVPTGMGSGLQRLAARVRERGGEFEACPSGSGFDVCARWPLAGQRGEERAEHVASAASTAEIVASTAVASTAGTVASTAEIVASAAGTVASTVVASERAKVGAPSSTERVAAVKGEAS
nr:hypothetical protein [Actinomycetales bacterium]